MINCLECRNMLVKNELAHCKLGLQEEAHGFEKIFNCRKQILRYGEIRGFTKWEIPNCIVDGIDNFKDMRD